MSQQGIYPVSLTGELTEPPARGWWLIKWLLGILHYIILVFLWIAFIIVCIIAFFAILFTAKYPRSLFNFNAGVLRWTWRVGFTAMQLWVLTSIHPLPWNLLTIRLIYRLNIPKSCPAGCC